MKWLYWTIAIFWALPPFMLLKHHAAWLIIPSLLMAWLSGRMFEKEREE